MKRQVFNMSDVPQPLDATAVTGSTKAEEVNVVNAPNQPTGEVDTKMQISNMSELKEKAPEVWNQTLKAIAQDIVRSVNRSQERQHEAMKRQRYNN
jgi:hypothetical protein